MSHERVFAEPLSVTSGDELAWDDTADVVVVGFGGAGAAAAIQAAQGGAEVVALDRFDGGGATAFSGGVVYAGATDIQRAAGVDDSVENMIRYLSLEVGGVVSPATVRRYCADSAANLEWLQRLGVPFSSELYSGKTTYPPDGKYLYYSGNEKVANSAAVATPAPRGHRTQGDGFTGRFFFAALRQAAVGHGVRLRPHSWVRRLVMDGAGTVLGVETIELPASEHARHQKLYDAIHPMAPFKEVRAERMNEKARALEREKGVPRLIRARRGVVLSTGGYVYDLKMLAHHAPLLARHYASLLRMGSLGDDGSADRLGRSAGGSSALMDNFFVGRVLSPPAAFLNGILVNQDAQRFVNEATYLGSLGKAIVEQPEGTAWLILDRASYRRAWWQIFTGGWHAFKLFGVPSLLNMVLGGTRKAASFAALAQRCGLDRDRLLATLERYNQLAAKHLDEDYEKLGDYLRPISDGPCVALNVSLSNKYSFMQVFSLGGLRVDEATGAVLRHDGSIVPGLYAAGRAAVGLPSNRYISGLSLGDCVFSGRRAAQSCLTQNQSSGTAVAS